MDSPRRGEPERGSATIEDLGEIGLVDRLVAICGENASADLVGPGDDAAVVGDARVVLTTDLAVEGRHFRRDWSSAQDIGHRVAAANLSDVVAMGARPTGLVVGLALPGDTPVDWVEDLMRGVVAEAAGIGSAVVGGDVTAADAVVVSVAAIGDLQGAQPILRSGATPGDVLAVAGRLGWAAAGLAVLSRGFRSPRALVDAYRRPEPPYEAGLAAADAGAHALMDVSDGLLLDASRLALASQVVIDLDSAALEVPEPIASAAAAYNLDPLQWILGGGDDHAFLAVFGSGESLPAGFTAIGRVLPADESGQVPVGTVLVDGRRSEVPAGFEHFRR